ncbi:NUDIX hydrolase [Photobacterium leiognathi]|uniref:NUDIX hydrolase n=1 Tax=Photobacterium leiognathi TaxID=553611 RepID=UPI0029815B25|nr:NUDIX hydrolase [Photobacterium leiognathi]
MIEQYSNPWFSVIKDGKYHYVKEFGAYNGAVVLVESDIDYIFVKVGRAAHSFQEQIEAPRGYGEKNSTSKETAIRELYEETGYLISENQLLMLGKVKPNSAILSSEVDLYLAQVSESQKVKDHDSEVTSVVKIPKQKVKKLISEGVISDSFTLSAFALLWSRER